ncbi:MAG: hypothetical protein ACREA2_11720 [Blastocatellia bacterium]
MSKRFVFIEDLHASEIGMDFEMGLLYSKGQIVDNLLPGIEELLLLRKKIIFEDDWWKLRAEIEQQQQAADEEPKSKAAPRENKRGRGALANKTR